MDRNFDRVLRGIRDSGEQKKLEDRDVRARFKALGFALLFGVLVLFATSVYLMGVSVWITMVLGILALVILGAWDRANVQSVVVAEEQDRRYFLSCLRNAHSIDELNRAGFFAYLPDSNSPDWAMRVRAEVANFKKALEVEPEWFQGT